MAGKCRNWIGAGDNFLPSQRETAVPELLRTKTLQRVRRAMGKGLIRCHHPTRRDELDPQADERAPERAGLPGCLETTQGTPNPPLRKVFQVE